jgi:uncharacterized membrane protein YfcA
MDLGIELWQLAVLIGVGIFSGGINAIVGSGTFFSFPVLLWMGVPPIAANATSKVGLWPASLVAAHTYLPELRMVKQHLFVRSMVALAGGTLGALLLLATSEQLFYRLIPWLIGGATLLFAFSKQIVQRTAHFGSRTNTALMLVTEFIAAVYGGYFGAGVGVVLMAALALGGELDPQIANAQKNLYAGLNNGAAVVIFVAQGVVLWSFAIPLIAGAFIGGYLGAHLARSIPGAWLRQVVIAVGLILTAIYFRSAYFP